MSEATLVCLLAGRTQSIQKYQIEYPDMDKYALNSRLVGYCSDQAHSSIEKAALIGFVQMRYIESDENLSMRGDKLRESMEKDIEIGLLPFWVRMTTDKFVSFQRVGLE